MRLVSYEHAGRVGVGVRVDDRIHPAGYDDMLALIRAGEAGKRAVQGAAQGSGAAAPRIGEVRLLAPIRSMEKLLFCGINYRSHLDEMPTAKLPDYPRWFAKLPSAIIGPGEPIVMPSPETQLDYEAELAVVIGRRARKVARADALDHVFGYTVVNDVSARDVQFTDGQITLGKGCDTFCPMGPELVLADEIGDPSKLRVASRVNGDRRQSAPTSELLFDVPALIEFLSARVTLVPGDLVSTGTPAGVGCFRNPPLFLRPGDVVEVEVDRIGRLSNPVVTGW